MKFKGLRYLCAALVLALTAGMLTAAEKLPGNVVAVVSTKAMDAAFADVDALVGETVKNTPFMMMVPAGTVKMGLLTGGLNLPPELTDGARGMHLIVSLDPAKPEVAAASLALPVQDLAGKIKALTDAGATAQSVETGVYKVTTTGSRGPVTYYLLDAGKGWVVFDEDLNTGKMTQKVLAGWTPADATTTVSGVVEVAKIAALHKANIEQIPDMLVAAMKKNDKGDGKNFAAFEQIFHAYGKILVSVIQGVERIEFTAEASADGLELSCKKIVVPGSEFGKFQSILAAQTSDVALAEKGMKLLPADGFSIGAINCGTDSYKFIGKMLVDFKSALASVKESDPQAQATLAKVVQILEIAGPLNDAFAKSDINASVFSYGIDASGAMNQTMFTQLKAGTGEALYKAIESSSGEMIKLINELMANNKDAPVSMTYASKTIGGTQAMVFDSVVTIPDDAKSNPAAAAMLEKMLKSYHYCAGIYKDLLIVVMGPQAEAGFEAAMKRIDGGASIFPAGRLKEYQDATGKNLFYSAFYLDSAIKQFYSMFAPLLDAQPDAKLIAGEFVKGLTESGVSIQLTTGTESNAFVSSFSIPVASYKGLVDQGVKAYMMAAMQGEMRKQGGAKAAPKADEEEEDDAEDSKDSKEVKTVKDAADAK